MMTDDDATWMREAIAFSDRMVQDAIKNDPELAERSAEYQQGYVHGFTEARLAFLAWLTRQQKP